MDSIEKYNQYILKNLPNPAPVILKKLIGQDKEVFYVLVGVSKNVIDTINIDKSLPNSVFDYLKKFNIIQQEEEVEQLLYSGNLNKFKLYDKLVYHFPYRAQDARENKLPKFRDYTKTLEQQKNTMWLYNSCTSAKDSWKTAITKVDSSYGILLKIIKPII